MSDQPATCKDLIQYSVFVFIVGFLSAIIIVTGVRGIAVVAIVINTLIALAGFLAINDELSEKDR